MKVDGTEYRADLIVFPHRIRPNWWRRQGHSLAIEDLNDVLGFKPELLVIGKGASGLMEIPASTKKTLQEQKIIPFDLYFDTWNSLYPYSIHRSYSDWHSINFISHRRWIFTKYHLCWRN